MTIYAYLMLTNVPPAKWLAPILSHPQPIGRAVECEIVVPRCFMTVSRRHAQIRVERDAILIQDLNSSGGTRLNGVSLTAGRETQVIFGDRIALAELEMFVVSPESRILRQPPAETVTSITALPESSIHVVGCGTFDSMEGRRLQKLSPAEFQVICWVSRGLTTFEEIGKSLFRSPHTIRTQLNSIYQKLHVHSRGELLAWLTKNEISWASWPDEDSDNSSSHKDSNFLSDSNVLSEDDSGTASADQSRVTVHGHGSSDGIGCWLKWARTAETR